jgi:hypothetical protein
VTPDRGELSPARHVCHRLLLAQTELTGCSAAQPGVDLPAALVMLELNYL